MNSRPPWSPSLDADQAQATVSGLSGPLPSGVDLALLSANGSRLTDEELQRLILESPLLQRPGSSNFDPITQVQ